MRFPYPLDNCECGHYRITHDSETNLRESSCNACDCTGFSLKESEDDRSDQQNRTQHWASATGSVQRCSLSPYDPSWGFTALLSKSRKSECPWTRLSVCQGLGR